MTKKFLALLLAVVMVCAMGIPVSAATPTTLQDAISAAAAGDTITLDKDYAESVIIDKSLTLDLNGHKLYTNNNNVTLTVKGSGVEVVIVDSSEKAEGMILHGKKEKKPALEIKESAKVILKSGTIEATGEDSATVTHAVVVTGDNDNNGGKFTMDGGVVKGYYGVRVIYHGDFIMNGGTVEATNYGVFPRGDNTDGVNDAKADVTVTINDGKIESGSYGISGNGNAGWGSVDITINGGSIKGTRMALYHPQENSKLTITGGTLEGATAVYVKSGKINITGGTFVGNGDKADFTPSGNGANPTGDAIVVEQAGGDYGAVQSINIANAHFVSENAAAITTHDSNSGDDIKVPEKFVQSATFEVKDTTLPANSMSAGSAVKPDGTIAVKYTATFVVDGETKATVPYLAGDTELSTIPAVPVKEGYYGYWAAYELNGNITINAKYVKIPQRSRVSFVADGRLVGIILYRANQDELTVLPKVPAKEGYVGTWAEYTLTGKNMIVRAVYTPIAE